MKKQCIPTAIKLTFVMTGNIGNMTFARSMPCSRIVQTTQVSCVVTHTSEGRTGQKLAKWAGSELAGKGKTELKLWTVWVWARQSRIEKGLGKSENQNRLWELWT